MPQQFELLQFALSKWHINIATLHRNITSGLTFKARQVQNPDI